MNIKKILLFVTLLSSAAVLTAETPKEGTELSTYVVIGGKSSLDILEAPQNAKMLHRQWGPESEKKYSVRVYAPLSADKWTRVSFKLKSESDGERYIALGGDHAATKDGYPKISAFYDNIRVSGKLIDNGDFESEKSLWSVSNPKNFPAKIVYLKNHDRAKNGLRAVRANSLASASNKFFAKKGEILEISFDARAALPSEMDDDVKLPLKEFANMGFADETPADGIGGWTDEGKSKSLKKFSGKIGEQKFEDISFNIIDPNLNGGAAVMTFKSKKSPTTLSRALIDLSQTPVKGRFIYLLHTVSKTPKLSKNESVGAIIINYTDGKREVFNVRYGIEVGDCWQADNSLRNAKIAFLSSKKKNRGAVYLTHVALDNGRTVNNIEFTTYGKAPWVVAAATISDKKVITCETTTPKDNPDWVLADMPADATVIKGSALDVSSFSKIVPAGSLGRVIVSERGTMAFENAPDKDVRFKGFSFYPQSLLNKFDETTARENIKKYAALMPVNGYNLVRIGFDYIKSDKRREERAAKYDQIDFLISEFKKNGIYIHLPLAWYDIGTKDYNFYKRNDVKIRAILGEAEARGMWKETAEEQLNHYNPYTKLAWKDDPVFQVIEYYNELNICFNKYDEFEPETQKLITKRWQEWLAKKYNGDIGALNTAWKGQHWAARAGAPAKSFDDIRATTTGFEWEYFCQDINSEFLDLCEKTVRATGYKGIVVQRNLGRSPYDSWMRHKISESIITNSYYEHPNGIYVPGADHTCNQDSSIARTADYWRTVATTKLFDRPITATEYNHAYWNKHRFEMMTVFAPYSAFQNFSTLVIHADAIEWGRRDKKCLSPFNVRESPAIRAAEFFNQCFFMRGDVKPSNARVDMAISEKFVKENKRAIFGLGGQQMRIPLIVGFALRPEAKTPDALKNVKVKKADLEILPNGSSEVITEGWFQQVVDSNNGTFSLAKFVEELKKRGILSADNISDPDNGVFQTDTKQITMDSRNLTMKVVTDFSCAATVHSDQKVDMGALKLLSTSVPASVGVAAIDGKKISESSRLVFVYATEENNEDSVTSLDGVLSFNSGRGPIVMRRGKVSASLKLDPSKKYSVYPLALNGERREKLDAEFADGVLNINIDNGKLKNGAVSMFEIAAE